MRGWLKNTAEKLHMLPHQPDAEWIASASQVHPLTPDLVWLTRRHFQLLFVYGTQMRGHPQHELVMEHGAYAATTYTDGKFSLWKKRLGKESFPIALENSGWRRPDWNVPPFGRVQGELYAISTEQLIALDKHYQNTLEFQRKRVPLVLPYRKLFKIPGTEIQRHIEESLGIEPKSSVVTTQPGVQLVKAHMYIGRSDYWDNQLEYMFSSAPLHQPRLGWLGDYYVFTKEEYSR